MLLTQPWDRLLWTGQFRVQFLSGATFCSLLQNVMKDSGAHPATHSAHTRVSSLGTKWWVCEVNHHSSPTSAEVKKEWSYTSPRTLCFHGMARANFTSTFYLLVNKSSYLCSEECLAILIYIYSKPFNAHLPWPLCRVCYEIWSKTIQFISLLATGLWEKCILRYAFLFFGTRAIREQ